MSFISELQIGLWTGWWFSASFGIINLILMAVYRKSYAKRLFPFPPFLSRKEKVLSWASVFLFGRGMILFTVFVPLKLGTGLFYLGTTIFILGLIFHTIAMFNFAFTPRDEPVVKGAYRFSRHPMQVISIVMWLGVGISTTSWVIIAACCIQMFISYYFLVAQERFCFETYGERYRAYMEKTPRYFLF